jgi:hypothetical protein
MPRSSTATAAKPTLELVSLKPKPAAPGGDGAATPAPVPAPVPTPAPAPVPPLDPQTLADLELLGLKPRLPQTLPALASAVSRRLKPAKWTWDHAAAYRRLQGLVGGSQAPPAVR